MPSPLLSSLPRRVAVVSYRLGGTDGVSIEAAKWVSAFSVLGAQVRTVAGTGGADVLVPELAADAGQESGHGAGGDGAASLASALEDVDLVVVENMLSLPLNRSAGQLLSRTLAGRPALLRHHDLASQREQFRDAARDWPPDDTFWRHVTINERSRLELAARGISASTVYNRFDPDPPGGDRALTRSLLGFADDEVVVLQPTRAIRRKNVPGALALSAALGATYWLLGPAEDGYGPELEVVLSKARCKVVHRAAPTSSMPDAYAAADAVVLPSSWEGFGNPSIESAVHRRPLAIGNYPVAFELRRYGFSWFELRDPDPLARFLRSPDERVLDRNHLVARMRFSTADLPETLSSLVTGR